LFGIEKKSGLIAASGTEAGLKTTFFNVCGCNDSGGWGVDCEGSFCTASWHRGGGTFWAYLSMAFAQLTYWHGLRDIEACLRSLGGKLDACGVQDAALPYSLAR
jgi:hypothetical protein